MSINHNLEENLKQYIKTQDSQLFEETCYQPLKYLAASICKKYNVTADVDITINDLVSEAVIQLQTVYDAKKSKAKSFVYIIMSQYLLRKFKYENADMRKKCKTIFIEDIKDNDGNIHPLMEINVSLYEFEKHTLKEKKALFKRLKNKLHRKVAKQVINGIEHPERYEENLNSFTSDIATKAGCNNDTVREVLNKMKQILQEPIIQIF